MPSLRPAAALAVAMLAVAAVPAAADKVTGPDPLTTGSHYDRNPVAVEDGKDTLVFFARSQLAPCNRLQGCNPDNGPGSKYDLYMLRITKKGAGEPQLVAHNPDVPADFRGRTIAATETRDGTIHVFWADGGNQAILYHLSRGPKATSFTAPQAVAPQVFNVEAIAAPDGVRVYTEENGDVEAYRFEDGTLTDRTDAAAGQSIPKAIRDKKGRYRLTMTDGDVSVASSTDGLHFGPPQVVAPAEGAVTNWDPSLAQLDDGTYVLSYAPDTGDGSQHVELRASDDFVHWSIGFPVSDPDGWWDYWPEVQPLGGRNATLYYTSEAPVTDGGDPGTGHIWSATSH
jgi:hypothetical protein